MKISTGLLRKSQVFTQILIILSLIAFAVETIPTIDPNLRNFLTWFEIFTVGVFTIEYIARIYLARPTLKYVFSFFGFIDLISILPFYLSSGLDLRTIRALRLMRLFRILKLARYSSAMRRYNRAFVIAKEELILFGAAAVIILFLASVGIYYFENPAQPENFSSVFDSMWWAMATLTTVGYGDVYPVTLGGRVFTFFVLAIGLGVVAVPTGLIASALSKARAEESE